MPVADGVSPPGDDGHDGLPPWPLLLGVLGAVAALLIHLILPAGPVATPAPWQLTLTTFIGVAAGLTALVIERQRAALRGAFAMGWATVAAGLVWHNGPVPGWTDGDGLALVSFALATVVAAPLFQAWAGSGRVRYRAVHDHSWTNALVLAAGLAFLGVVWLVALLLAEMFDLIGIDLLEKLLREDWVQRVLSGAALGTGLGVLREQQSILVLLRRTVVALLVLLAPALAAGLALFLLALPLTGLTPLWRAGWSAASLTITCAVAALVLANGVIGNGREEEARRAWLRGSALVLLLSVLPLAGLALAAILIRLGQYGLTPGRLWALTGAIAVALVGLGCFGAILSGPRDWMARVRRANLTMAALLCAVAFILATPLVSFNALSARSQAARLESRRVNADRFDWAALGFAFGAPGRAELRRLADSRDPAIRRQAAATLAAPDRWTLDGRIAAAALRRRVAAGIRVLPAGSKAPADLVDVGAVRAMCADGGCTVVMTGPAEAVVIAGGCYGAPQQPVMTSCASPIRLVLRPGGWQTPEPAGHGPAVAYRAGRIEVRLVSARRIFVGDEAVGEPF
ncbi:DUF4153 domain-containing protein [Sphingomonas changnyeongensis]|uniref:DUF4153 domain-containing protein n=1 Tax=Sphingomonas changnyeongensis TaxID=2698679 RepID=A0A7Z2S893_9SPHN|nr:DUF4153 domain-containing protein [Sphingomonas changnyeongensis]QHL90417.1 DUF4153 domain-containing protein [Sphingomonas changnyeongensis]